MRGNVEGENVCMFVLVWAVMGDGREGVNVVWGEGDGLCP